jgi:glycosyltransferase involved in cell wall biosynthesis
MRILLINSMFVNAHYRRCADELGALPNVELTVLVPDRWRMNGGVLPLDNVRAGAPYRIVIGKAGWRGYENRGFYRSGLVRAISVARPEVIYLMEEPFSIFAAEVLAARALLGLNIPVVFFTWNNLSLSTFDYRPSIFYHTISSWSLPRFNAALTANLDGVRVLRDAGFRKPTERIGYGVDTKHFATVHTPELMQLREQLGLTPEDFVVGFIGRMLWMKGLDLLVEAFAEVRRSGYPNAKLLLVGSGDYETDFFREAKRLGVQSEIRHVRTVPQSQVTAYMHLLNALVLPSRRVGMWSEQFGRVLVEAMAAGVPVVGSNSGAIPEVIGDVGFTFLENDAADLARKLKLLIDLPSITRAQLIERGRMRAREEFTWHRFAQRSYAMLESVIHPSVGHS